MRSVARNVRDLESVERKIYEDILGERLHENQQVFVRVLTIPSQAARQHALDDLKQLSKEGSKHRESLGVSDEEANAILKEARDHARQPKSQ